MVPAKWRSDGADYPGGYIIETKLKETSLVHLQFK